MNEKIKLKDLSIGLKIPIMVWWISISIYLIVVTFVFIFGDT